MSWFDRLYSWVTDQNNGIPIESTRMDAEDNNFAAGINSCLNINGQNSPTSNISWGGFLINNLGSGVSSTDAANVSQVQTRTVSYATDSGSTNTYVITLSPALTAYAAGQTFFFSPGSSNTSAATLNINSLGAKTIKKDQNVDLVANDLRANQICCVAYDGTNFQLLSPPAGLLNQTSSAIYAADATSSDSYVISLAPAITSYATGLVVYFKANTANTANGGASTLNINSLGAKNIKKDQGAALAPGDIQAGQIVQVIYDGTNFQLLSPIYGTIGQNGLSVYAADTGSSNAYAISLSPAAIQYTTGMIVRFKASFQNTSAATLNVNSLGAISLKKFGSTALASGDITNGLLVEAIYDGTNFQIISPLATAGTVTSVATGDGLSGGTITSTGTLTVASGVCVQVQTTTLTGQVTTSSSSFADLTGLSVTITPKHNTSTILILVGLGAVASSTSGNSIMFQLKRGSNTIGVGSVIGSATQCTAATFGISSSSNVANALYMSYVDSPATTSSTTYKVQWLATSGTAYTNTSNTTSSSADPSAISTITVIEIY